MMFLSIILLVEQRIKDNSETFYCENLLQREFKNKLNELISLLQFEDLEFQKMQSNMILYPTPLHFDNDYQSFDKGEKSKFCKSLCFQRFLAKRKSNNIFWTVLMGPMSNVL